MEEYTTRELYLIVKSLHEKMDDHKTDLTEIKEQVKTTNGRVAKLELWQSSIKGVLAFIVIIILPMAFDFIKNIFK